MATQQLIAKGRLLSNSKSLPKLAASRIITSCNFSTTPNVDTNNGGDANIDLDNPPPPPSSKKKHSQSFVQDDIELGLGELETELPPGFYQRMGTNRGQFRNKDDGRDSYWRPPWKNPRAEIISAEDFANRPRVTFSESFLTMHDAMAVETWMSQAEKEGIYTLYVEMMTAIAQQQQQQQKQRNKTTNTTPNTDHDDDDGDDDVKDKSWQVLSAHTSHEYVVRVVAQKFNITTSRAAGIIQLQHNEEQLKKDPDFNVNHALQELMDAKMREHIRETYQAYGETDPLSFTEEPLASSSYVVRERAGSDKLVTASELTDVDALAKATRMRELKEAEVRIKNHVYVEDVDPRSRKVKLDHEAKRLMKAKKELQNNKPPPNSNNNNKKQPEKKLKIPKGASPFPENNRGYNETPETRRPRWKFAAQIINTHTLENPPNSSRRGKKVAARAKARRHGRIVDGNTIIEEDGKLRCASVAELEQTSWKSIRNESEFMFKGVKDAWMRRQLDGEVGGWGMQEEVFKVEQLPESKEEDDEAVDTGDVADGDEEEEDSTEEEK